MTFREWLEEWYSHKGWSDDPEKKLAHRVLHAVMAEFDRRFTKSGDTMWIEEEQGDD